MKILPRTSLKRVHIQKHLNILELKYYEMPQRYDLYFSREAILEIHKIDPLFKSSPITLKFSDRYRHAAEKFAKEASFFSMKTVVFLEQHCKQLYIYRSSRSNANFKRTGIPQGYVYGFFASQRAVNNYIQATKMFNVQSA